MTSHSTCLLNKQDQILKDIRGLLYFAKAIIWILFQDSKFFSFDTLLKLLTIRVTSALKIQ